MCVGGGRGDGVYRQSASLKLKELRLKRKPVSFLNFTFRLEVLFSFCGLQYTDTINEERAFRVTLLTGFLPMVIVK